MGNEGVTAVEPNPERQARYRWAAQLTAGGRVLDAACGAGWGTAVLAQAADEAVGVDFSPGAIEDAQRDHGGTATFVEGDLRRLPFGDGEFEHVVCFEAICHVAEPAPVLDELRRVLRPTGMLAVSAPNRRAYPPGNPLHLSELSPEELEELLRARFANVAIHRQQSYFATLLGDTAALEEDDPTRALGVQASKLAGGPAGSELHAVAVASDADLPAPPSALVLGELVDYLRQQELLETWQDRAVEAEAKALAHARKLRERKPG